MPRVVWFGIMGATGHYTTGSLTFRDNRNPGRPFWQRFTFMRSLRKYTRSISPEASVVQHHASRKAVLDGLRLLTPCRRGTIQTANGWTLCPKR